MQTILGAHVIKGMAVAACCLTMVSVADAQTFANPEQRPGQGLFGRTSARDERLDVSISAAGAYDDSLIAEQGSDLTDPRTQLSGPYNDVNARISYAKKLRHVSFGVSEGSTVRYYPTLGDLVSARHSFAAGVSVQSARTSMRLSQTFEYAPFFTYQTFPQLGDSQLIDAPLPTSSDFIMRHEARNIGSSLSVSHLLGGRTSLQFAASTQSTEFLQNGSGQRTSTASGRIVYHVTRDVGLVAGYVLEEGRYQYDQAHSQTTPLHHIDAGIDYNHALSLTRRTTVGFTSGSTILQGVDGTSDFRVTGDAHLNHQIGRTWNARAAYTRSAGLVEGFPQPLFADSLAFDLGGALNPRVTLSVRGGYSRGYMVTSNTFAGSQAANYGDNENQTGSAHLRFAMSRLVAISAEYAFYRYRFDEATVLPAGMPPRLDRQTLRVGLDLWLPLIR